MDIGRIGVWTWGFDHLPWPRASEAAREVEELGYGTIWFGEGTGRDAPTQSALLLGATRRIVVAPAPGSPRRGCSPRSARACSNRPPGGPGAPTRS